MIKGINHQMIEISDTQNIYYERAFLVLKPEYACATQELLEKEAKKLLRELDTVSCANSKKLFRKKLFSALIFTFLGAILGACIYALF